MLNLEELAKRICKTDCPNKKEAIFWWRQYFRAVKLLKNCRRENRVLRLLVLDSTTEVDMLREELYETQNKKPYEDS